MKSSALKTKIDEIYEELEFIRDADEEVICEQYNVDKREEAMAYAMEELEGLLQEYEELESIEEENEYNEIRSIRISSGNPRQQLLMNY